MSQFYREHLAKAKELTAADIRAMGLSTVWRGELIFDRLQEPLARPVVVNGQNGFFPAYIFEGRYVTFVTLPCETLDEACQHSQNATRCVLLNE